MVDVFVGLSVVQSYETTAAVICLSQSQQAKWFTTALLYSADGLVFLH